MTGIKKLCALVLVLMLVVSAGIFTVSGAETSDVNEVAADASETTGITIHVRHKDLTQPYIYLWNSLPTNSAMSKSYPGEKMTSANGWFNYYVADVNIEYKVKENQSTLKYTVRIPHKADSIKLATDFSRFENLIDFTLSEN